MCFFFVLCVFFYWNPLVGVGNDLESKSMFSLRGQVKLLAIPLTGAI